MNAQALILCLFLVPIGIAPNIGNSQQTKPEECPYENNKDENGRDLIYIEESLQNGNKRFCCGCPRNMKLVKPCKEGVGKMHTTRCEDCEFGTEIRKKAHQQTFCDVIPYWRKPNTEEILGLQQGNGASHPPWYIILIFILLFVITLLLIQLYRKVYKIRCGRSTQTQKNDDPVVENNHQANNREDGEILPQERHGRQSPDRLLEENEVQHQLLGEIDDGSSADGEVQDGRRPELNVEPQPMAEAVVEHDGQGVSNPQPIEQPDYVSKAVQTSTLAEAGVQTQDAGDVPVKMDKVEPPLTAETAPTVDQAKTVPLTHHGPDETTNNGFKPNTKEGDFGYKKVAVPVRKRSSLKDVPVPEDKELVGFDHLEMQPLNGASRETENTQKEIAHDPIQSIAVLGTLTRRRTVSQASYDLEFSDGSVDSVEKKPKKQNKLKAVYDFISGFVDKPECRSIAIEIGDVIKFGRDFGLNESLLRVKPDEAPHTALYNMLVAVHNKEGNKLTLKRVVKSFRKQNKTLLADEMENYVKEKAKSS